MHSNPVEFKKCRKCQADRVGMEWIRNSVNDVMASDRPKTGTDSQNILNRLVAHVKLESRDGKPPCSLCLYEYGQMINDAVYSFKKQNYTQR